MWKFLKRVILATVLLGTGALVFGGVYLYPKYREYQKIADGFDLNEIDRIPAISVIYDLAGMPYSRLPGEVRYVVPLAEISPNFVNAVIAREDSRFYDHHGVDLVGIARAVVRNLSAGGVKEGASTLTQQLARNTFDLGNDRWRRKFVEALLALRIEKNLTKEQIFEAYANRIYFGVGVYGVESVSRACFGKSAKDLTLSEAAILAGLIRSPNRLSPLEDSRAALVQRDQVLARMKELKMITPAIATAARAEPLPAGKRQPPHVLENYATDAVIRDLAILLPKDVIDRGGLKIYTTIDRRLQMLGEKAVDSELAAVESQAGWPHPPRKAPTPALEPATAGTESAYVQGALVAIDNGSGGIRAVVGGRDFKDSPYNRALLSRRQIGSTFKPFVYGAAIARGLSPGTLVDDSPIQNGDVAGLATTWSPENSDGDNLGLQPAEVGLIRSRNTMTIRVGEMVTRSAVRQLALNAGLEKVPDMPAIYLGAFGTTLKSLTAAYTMFPNDGVRKQAYIIDHIDDRHGRTVYRAAHVELRCLSPAVNFVMNGLLRKVVTNGTASSASSIGLTIPAAGKTGTTDDYKDAWFVGYTTQLTCGVWVGMDRPQRIADHGYGSKFALPIWIDFMQNAAAYKYEPHEFQARSDLREVDLCRVSGGVATDECRAAGASYRAELPGEMIPDRYCGSHAGLFAGMPTTPAPAPQVAQQSGAVPVARALAANDPAVTMDSANVPVAAAVSAGPPGAAPAAEGKDWQMIPQEHGFIFVPKR